MLTLPLKLNYALLHENFTSKPDWDVCTDLVFAKLFPTVKKIFMVDLAHVNSSEDTWRASSHEDPSPTHVSKSKHGDKSPNI